jgi:hypothetical protein
MIREMPYPIRAGRALASCYSSAIAPRLAQRRRAPPGLRFRGAERVSTFSEHRLAWLGDRAKRCSEKVLTRSAPYIDSCALCSVFIKRSRVLCEVFDPAGRRPARPPAAPRAAGGLRGPSDPAGPQDPMGLRPRGASHSKSQPCAPRSDGKPRFRAFLVYSGIRLAKELEEATAAAEKLIAKRGHCRGLVPGASAKFGATSNSGACGGGPETACPKSARAPAPASRC